MPEVHWPSKPISPWGPYEMPLCPKYTNPALNLSAFEVSTKSHHARLSAFEVHTKSHHARSTLTFFQTHQPLRSIWNATMPKVHQPCSKPVSLWGLYQVPSCPPVSLWGPYQVPSCPKYTDLLPIPPALEVHTRCHHTQSTHILFSTHQDLLQRWSPMWHGHVKIPFWGILMCMECTLTN